MRIMEWFKDEKDRKIAQKTIIPQDIETESQDKDVRDAFKMKNLLNSTEEDLLNRDLADGMFEQRQEQVENDIEFMGVLANHLSDLLEKLEDEENTESVDHNIDLTTDFMNLVEKDIAKLSSLLDEEYDPQNKERPNLKETMEKIENSKMLVDEVSEVVKKKEQELTAVDVNKLYNFLHMIETAMFSLQKIKNPDTPELN